jgi:hypothetical protein
MTTLDSFERFTKNLEKLQKIEDKKNKPKRKRGRPRKNETNINRRIINKTQVQKRNKNND